MYLFKENIKFTILCPANSYNANLGRTRLKIERNTLRKLGMLRVLTESGIEFQIDAAILVKDFFIFSVPENLTEKHSFADNRLL